MEKKTKKQKNTDVADNISEIGEEKPKKSLSPIQKVKLMNDFASAATNDSLKDMFLSLPNGEMIYDIFVDSINNKISEMMENKEAEFYVANISESLKNLDLQVSDSVKTFVEFVSALKHAMGTGGIPKANTQMQQNTQQKIIPGMPKMPDYHSNYRVPEHERTTTTRQEEDDFFSIT